MCQLNCRQPATHLVHATNGTGISLDTCDTHLDQARAAVADMATKGAEVVASPMRVCR